MYNDINTQKTKVLYKGRVVIRYRVYDKDEISERYNKETIKRRSIDLDDQLITRNLHRRP